MRHIKNYKPTKEREKELEEKWNRARDGWSIPVNSLSELLFLKQLENNSKSLPTPDEHNKMRRTIDESIKELKHKTGVRCSECGTTMGFDGKKNFLATTQKVYCPKCGVLANILT